METEAMVIAVDACGGPSKLAGRLNRTTQAVCNYRDGRRRVPVELISAIEREAGYRVGARRWNFRPLDWHVIWPELIGADGAPPPPVQPTTEEPSDAAA